jgi:S1-C subfamily serine protease
VTTFQLDKDLASVVNVPVGQGALVQSVAPGGPADRAGIRAGKVQTDQGIVLGGDILIEVDGEKVAKPEDVAAAIADNKPGQSVAIRFFRSGRLMTKRAKLGTRPASLDAQAPPSQDQGSTPALP